MRAYYCDHFVLPLPSGHRFPMAKYRRLRERAAREPGLDLTAPPAASDADLERAHDPCYVERAVSGALDRHEIRALGFPWSPQLIARSRRSVGATMAAARAALTEGAAANLAGGTHHAQPAAAQGFCVFNDCAVAIRALQASGAIERALVVDTDVHQGNGTAAIFADDDRVATLSLHGARNFPARKFAGDADYPLAEGTGDTSYLDTLARALDDALARTRPEIVFYLAGADPFVDDRLGRLALSKAGLAERDAAVARRCHDAGVPVVVVMAGGYAPSVDDIVDIHFHSVVRVAPLVGSASTGVVGGRGSR